LYLTNTSNGTAYDFTNSHQIFQQSYQAETASNTLNGSFIWHGSNPGNLYINNWVTATDGSWTDGYKAYAEVTASIASGI
jgi:hypothetical protein